MPDARSPQGRARDRRLGRHRRGGRARAGPARTFARPDRPPRRSPGAAGRRAAPSRRGGAGARRPTSTTRRRPSGSSSEAVARFGGLDVLINNAGLRPADAVRRRGPGRPPPPARGQLRRPADAGAVGPAPPDRAAGDDHQHRLGDHAACPTRRWGPTARPRRGWPTGTTPSGASWRHKGVKVCLVEPGPVKTEFFARSRRWRRRAGNTIPCSMPPPRGCRRGSRTWRGGSSA